MNSSFAFNYFSQFLSYGFREYCIASILCVRFFLFFFMVQEGTDPQGEKYSYVESVWRYLNIAKMAEK